MHADQLSLFSTPSPHDHQPAPTPAATRLLDPQAVFDTWLDRQTPSFRKSSRKIYRWIWGKFIRHMQEEGVDFLSIEPNDITVFLSSLDINRPQRERYHKIIGRAFEDLTQLVPNLSNPATHLIDDPFRRTWRDAPSNEPMQFLSGPDQQRLSNAIQSRYIVLRTTTQQTEDPLSFSAWKDLRDLSIISLLFSCGIKPAELSVLSVSCIFVDAGRPVLDVGAYQGITTAERQSGGRDPHQDATHAWKQEGQGAQRRIPVPGWAYRVLSMWLAERERELAESGQMTEHTIKRLFPGSRKPSAARPNSVMNMATLARIVTKWGLSHANLELTAQRLRNTYGAQLVEQDKTLPEIEQLMGYAAGAASAFRLKTAWLAFSAKHANLDADAASRETRERTVL